MSVRYLEAKRTVDDRSLSSRAIDRLLASLPEQVRIFEAGCGTGATIPRLLNWGVAGTYHGVDTDGTAVRHARDARPAELRARGIAATETATGFRTDSLSVAVEQGDALTAVEEIGPLDLLVAQQVMDLVDQDRALSAFTDAVGPGGLLYFPLTFDGATIFQPAHPLDAEIVEAYHATMDARPNGDSRAGRQLATRLQRGPGELLVMAPSDAIVRPRDGAYPADEAFVLGSILDFVADELSEHDVPGVDEWLDTRRAQLRARELIYVAHRYDLLYRLPD